MQRPGRRTDEPTRHSLCPFRRQSWGLCCHETRCRTHTAQFSGDDLVSGLVSGYRGELFFTQGVCLCLSNATTCNTGQKIPVYGTESSKANGRLKREDTGNPENTRRCQIFKTEKGIELKITSAMRQDWRKCSQDETDPIEATFELNNTLYARANIPPTDEVYIWLGVSKSASNQKMHICIWPFLQANVMLSYPIDEAEVLLGSKLSTAQTSLSNCEEDLDFLREQITVCISDN